MADLEKIIDILSGLTVLQASELSKALEEKWGVSASAPVTMVAAANSSSAAPEAEKTNFDIILEAAGDKKLEVIREVKNITGLGLKEAKELVDGAPKEVKKGVLKEEAEKIKAQLEAAGATIKLQ